MITQKTWNEFRSTGLFLFINSILHAFGWAIVLKIDKETGECTECFPVRTKYRGFNESDSAESYKNIAAYLKDNAESIYGDTHV